jgi:predicted nucleotidyltransferase
MVSKEARLREALSPVLERLKEELGRNLLALVLFGSRARDEMRPTSDWDLFLLARALPASPLDRYAGLRRGCGDEPEGGVSFLAKTRDEFEGGFPSFYLDLALDGIILFDTDGYMETRLERIRELTREAGLNRKSIAGGFFWDWEKSPGPDWEIDWNGFRAAQ